MKQVQNETVSREARGGEWRRRMATNAQGGTRGRTCANPNQLNLDGVGTLTLARWRRNPNRLTLVVGVGTLTLALTLMGGPLTIRIRIRVGT